jgi:outer membrane receptor protein involved in Fe transport
MEGTQALPLSMWGNTKQAYTYPDSIKNKLAMISLKGTHFLADDKLIAGNVYYRMSIARSFNSHAQSLNDAQNVTSSTFQDGYGGSFQLSLLKDLMGYRNNFTLGASADWSRVTFNQDSQEAYLENYQTITVNPLATPADYVRLKTKADYYGLYATNNLAFNDQINLTLSGRYNIAKVNLIGGNNDLGPGALTGNHRYNRFNPAVGLNYNPNKLLGFYGGYNEGMRAPTPIELSCADEANPCSLPAGFNSDPDLKKVVAKTWEVGVRGKLMQDINWNVGVYDTRANNDIQFIYSNASQGYFQNVGQTERKGVEIGLHGKVNKLNFAANYGYVDATYESSFPVNTIIGEQTVNKGNKIPGIARQTFKLRISYDMSPTWKIGGNLVAASGQYAHGAENNQTLDGVSPKIPGYTILNLDTNYNLTSNWSLFAKVNNVLDKEYSTFGQLEQNIYTGLNEQFRTPSAPRAGWLGVTYNFGGTEKINTD